jgi:hypothetical protein
LYSYIDITTTPFDQGIFIFIFIFKYILVLIYKIDIKMHSPPRLHGSSRMTGGIIRGHALGNMLNAADLDNNTPDLTFPIPGKVLVYSSNQDPANLNVQDMKPSTFVKHPVTSSIQDVLSKVSGRYSPIQSKFFFELFCIY